MAQITTGCTSCERYFRCDEFLVGTRVNCPHCGTTVEVRPFERTSIRQVSRAGRRWILVAGIAFCVTAAAVVLVLWLRTRVVFVAHAIPAEPNPLTTGEIGFLSVANVQVVWVAVDEQSVHEWFRTGIEQDQVKLKQLMDQQKVFTVPKNTSVLVLETGPLLNKIRLQDGADRGSDVWISPIFIYRTRQ